MNSKQILALIELIIQVGVPAAMEGWRRFQLDDDPSPEEIKSLSNQLKPVESYWKDDDD